MIDYAIIDRGRGPEIAGSRITVYDVLAETQAGATPEELARWYRLNVAQIHLALRYIEEHKEEVLRDYQAIKARHARGNSPEVPEKVNAAHAKYAPLWAKVRQQAQPEEQGALDDANSWTDDEMDLLAAEDVDRLGWEGMETYQE
jgi:uncharacterized protein (DUF433 family)